MGDDKGRRGDTQEQIDPEVSGERELRPLSVLRAWIDVLDHDVLQLLARRMSLVGELAATKRAEGRRIRDLTRERALLADRGERAAKLGLPRGTVENVYRLLMLAARDRQAALRAELPQTLEPKTVAIIGGEGGMGRSLARLFGDLGHAVISADVDTSVTPAEAASVADVVIISVPIDVTEQVIAELGPRVRSDALLCDVTSVKGGPLAAMLAATEASGAAVVGTHPMFGPGVHHYTGQRVVLCRGRGDAWYEWLASCFRARGLVVNEADARQHDEAMGVVQLLNHFNTQVLGLTLARLGIPHETTMAFTSPSYLLESYVAARHFNQSARLYGPIEMRSPVKERVTEAYQRAARELADVVVRGDQDAFGDVFDEVRAYFGTEFMAETSEQSAFLIDRLIELSAGRSVEPPDEQADARSVEPQDEHADAAEGGESA